MGTEAGERASRRGAWAVAGVCVAIGVASFVQLVRSLTWLWHDLPNGGTVGAERVVIGSGLIPIVGALLWFALSRHQRWAGPVTWATTAVVATIGSCAGFLIAFGANLNSR